MIKASLLYAAITMLLALIDAIRIKRAKGIVANINHETSVLLAIWSAAIPLSIVFWNYHTWTALLVVKLAMFVFAFIALRLLFYDGFLNIFRRMKIDYESPTTSSYVDQHTNKLTFWDKRILALAAWFALASIHWLIFKA